MSTTAQKRGMATIADLLAIPEEERFHESCEVPHCWIVDPAEETLEVCRWHADGYLQVLTAERGDRVRPEPFDAIELSVGVLFGDDEDDD